MVKVLASEARLGAFRILPLSGAQLIDTDGKLTSVSVDGSKSGCENPTERPCWPSPDKLLPPYGTRLPGADRRPVDDAANVLCRTADCGGA